MAAGRPCSQQLVSGIGGIEIHRLERRTFREIVAERPRVRTPIALGLDHRYSYESPTSTTTFYAAAFGASIFEAASHSSALSGAPSAAGPARHRCAGQHDRAGQP